LRALLYVILIGVAYLVFIVSTACWFYSACVFWKLLV